MNKDILELKQLCDQLESTFNLLRDAVNEAIEDFKEKSVDNSQNNVKLLPFSIKRTH